MVAALPTVSVVMPTYNRRQLLPRVLAPLLAQPAATEVVVVVDGCRDGSLEFLQGLAATDPRLRPVFVENCGESAARHVGAEVATGDVLLFLDDDVEATPYLVEGHARHHLRRHALVLLGHMPTTLPPRRRHGQFATFLYAAEYARATEEWVRAPETVLRSFWSGNFSIRREDALRVGLASPRFRDEYHQDHDFGLRCLKAGLVGEYVPHLVGYHLHNRSLSAFLKDARRQGAGRRVMHECHGDLLGPFVIDDFDRDLPAPVRVLVRASATPPLASLLEPALIALLRLSGSVHVWRLETAAARVLRRVGWRRGASIRGHGTEGGRSPSNGWPEVDHHAGQVTNMQQDL